MWPGWQYKGGKSEGGLAIQRFALPFIEAEPVVSERKVHRKRRNCILYLGKEVFEFLNDVNSNDYDFIQARTAKTLHTLMVNWEEYVETDPVAILVYDKLLPNLLLEDVIEAREKSVFKNTPIFVFSKKMDRLVLHALRTIQADDYLFEKIDFCTLVSRINVFRSLKKAGISTWGITKEEDLDISTSISFWNAKRLFDIVVSFSALLVLSPLLLLIALAVKLESKGPVFYTSKRAGRNYKIFDFYKFRSMYKDADSKLEELKKTNNQYKDGNQQFVKIKNDPRITKIGNFLRNTSLDEIPQLLNVLKGDMSLVGNRPLPLYEAETLTVDDHAARFLGPAGITGLWQVLKRGKDEVSSEERIMLDIIYVRKNSLWFDLKLIFMTVPALLQSEKV